MAEEKDRTKRKADDTELAEGSAWLGGGAAGAALGSLAGPLGTAAGAVAGGMLADEAVENADAAPKRGGRDRRNPGQRDR